MSDITWRRMIVLSTLVVALAIQGWFWFSHMGVDIELWAKASSYIGNGVLPPMQSPTPSHPGATIILPTGALIALGIPSVEALYVTMTVLVSICIAFIVYLCHVLRPRDLWWMTAVAILVPNPLYLMMTPPSVFAGLLTVIYVLLLLRAYEHKNTGGGLFWLGLVGGILLATRIDIGAAIIVTSLPLIWLFARERIFVVFLTAALFFAACDIYLWADPLGHLLGFSGQVGANANTPAGFGYSRWILLLSAMSGVLALISIYLKPKLLSVHHDFLLWMLAASCAICGAILLSDYHPVRYFFPIMIVWEVFLGLFVLDTITTTHITRMRGIHLAYVAIALLFIARVVPGAMYMF